MNLTLLSFLGSAFNSAFLTSQHGIIWVFDLVCFCFIWGEVLDDAQGLLWAL